MPSRAGYDPRAGVTLWKKMMAANGGRARPSSCARTRRRRANQGIEGRLPRVLPMYEAADKPTRDLGRHRRSSRRRTRSGSSGRSGPADVRVGPALAPEGALRPVAGDEHRVVAHRPQPLRDAGDQRVMVAPRKVGAADAAGEQHVADEGAPRLGEWKTTWPGVWPGQWRTCERAVADPSPCRRRRSQRVGVKARPAGSRTSGSAAAGRRSRTGRPGAGR